MGRLLTGRGAREAALLTLGLWSLGFVIYVMPSFLIDYDVPLYGFAVFAWMALSGLALSASLYPLVRLSDALPFRRRVLLIGASVVAVALLHAVLEAVIWDKWMGHFAPDKVIAKRFQVAVAHNFLVVVWIHGLNAAGYGLILSFIAIHDRERRLAEAQSAAHQAQLTALRYQMNPHFLFNTLNAISTLVVTSRNEQAEQMLQRLSDFLRMSLTADPEAAAPLEDELGLVQEYLDIESVRFGPRLNVSIECPSELGRAGTPSFLLQPLVENAIKYAVAPSPDPVTVRVSAASDGENLVISIEDDGARASAPPSGGGAGVGLENVRRRLKALYGDRGALEAFALPGRGWRSVVRLPLEFAPA
jgi:hypothetical protein